jgi:hypothetical protein
MTTHFIIDDPIAVEGGNAYGIIADPKGGRIITVEGYNWPDDTGELQISEITGTEYRRDPVGFATWMLRQIGMDIAMGNEYGDIQCYTDRRPAAEWTTSEEGL